LPFEIDAKGRAVIPVAVRRAAGAEEGQTMQAQGEAPGGIVLETPEVIQARV
jgi:bifunctional DNA-binding transcriptional regulator/antitoxin component of YhaV-PrlF toxin-antitoxin module